VHLDFVQRQGPDLESDLRARDFTSNAIAIDLRSPSDLIDPLRGAADLHAKRLRACSPQSVRDDPVRVLRALRQASQFGLQIEPETRNQIRDAAEYLNESSAERRRDEIMKILEGSKPGTTLQAMEIIGINDYVFPDLIGLRDLPQPAPFVHTAWTHSLNTVRRLNQLLDMLGEGGKDPENRNSFVMGLSAFRLGRYRPQFRAHLAEHLVPERSWRSGLFLAALWANAGKAHMHRPDLPEPMQYSGHEKEGAPLAAAFARSLKLSAHEVQRIRNLIVHQHRPEHLLSAGETPSPLAIYRFFSKDGPVAVDVLLLNLATTWATYDSGLPQNHWLDLLELHRTLYEAYWEHYETAIDPARLIDGRDLMKSFSLTPGPLIGDLLELVREGQITGAINDQETALQAVRDQLKSRPDP
jgi:poly(A) polymerase